MNTSHILFLVMALAGVITLSALWVFEEARERASKMRPQRYHLTLQAMKADKRFHRGIRY